MDGFPQPLKEFIESFGLTVGSLVDYAKFAPFLIMGVAFIGFLISNIQQAKIEEHEKIAKKLKEASRSKGRGMSASELAARIAPKAEDVGIKKVFVSLAEVALKMAKFDRKETERKLVQSGDRDPRAISRYILQRGTGMLVAPILGWFLLPYLGFQGMMQIGGSIVCVLAGGIAVDIRLDKALKRRRENIATEFPVLLDLLTIYLEAGQAFDVALQRASIALRTSFPTAAEEIAFLRQDLEMSVDRERTFRDCSKRLSSSTASTFVAIVIQAERRGNAIAPSLRTLARESRKEVISTVEKKAQKLPTLMQGPMFIFILPSIFLSVIGPAIIQVLEQLGGR